jgi:transcriptional regulator with PAS, ATPase and Fis domain
MKRILVCWIGTADLKASENDGAFGLGPTAQAADALGFDEVVFLSDYAEKVTAKYENWLRSRTKATVLSHPAKPRTPTHFGDIYEAAVRVVTSTLERHDEPPALTFHLSPGTPQMSAVWVILSKTRFRAELIESSKGHGVNVVSVPFDISADFVADLMSQPDQKLEALAAGLPPEAPEFQDIIHRSPVMKEIIVEARRVAPRSVTVLIEGESGTGKELLARAMHRASPRRNGQFVAVNCGAIPDELIESELFGHEKGAFTGAAKRQLGKFEAAHEGTLFLDEVADLPSKAQVGLLRAVQEREIVRVGGVEPIPVDVRIVSATNKSLAREVSEDRFREDLYYRLAVAVIELPPIRERTGDLNPLIDHLLNIINKEACGEPGYTDKEISPAARNLMSRQSWRGNVRELFNILQRAALKTEGKTIGEEEVQSAMKYGLKPNADQILGRPLNGGLDLPAILSEVARHYLDRALKEGNGNKTKAAELLGFKSHQRLTNWLKKYGI